MRVAIGLCLIVMGANTFAYTDVDDNENIEAVVSSDDEMKDHIGCYLNRIPCTDRTLHYKNHMSEAVNDACRECNSREKYMYKTFLNAMRNRFPDDYQQYQTLYDPTGTHFSKLLAQLEKNK